MEPGEGALGENPFFHFNFLNRFLVPLVARTEQTRILGITNVELANKMFRIVR